MGDIKLFKIQNRQVLELQGKSVTVEKSLQALCSSVFAVIPFQPFLETHHKRISQIFFD